MVNVEVILGEGKIEVASGRIKFKDKLTPVLTFTELIEPTNVGHDLLENPMETKEGMIIIRVMTKESYIVLKKVVDNLEKAFKEDVK